MKDYIETLQAVYKLKKTHKLATKKGKSEKYVTVINNSLTSKTEEIRVIKEKIKTSKNRLDFAFITFKDEETRDLFLEKYQTNLFQRLYFKFCTCCSGTSIKGQHINVYPGPDPEDIDWINL